MNTPSGQTSLLIISLFNIVGMPILKDLYFASLNLGCNGSTSYSPSCKFLRKEITSSLVTFSLRRETKYHDFLLFGATESLFSTSQYNFRFFVFTFY